jgi:hypothetical protein
MFCDTCSEMNVECSCCLIDFSQNIDEVTISLQNLGISVNVTAVREMSGICQGKNLVRENGQIL